MASADFRDMSVPGGIVHNPASAYSREMAKWEMGYNPYGPPGRPREAQGHQVWPALFYRMTREKTAGAMCVTTDGTFYVEHYQEAADEAEGRNLSSRGYSPSQTAAITAIVDAEQAVAVAAANRAALDKGMSDKAKAEVAAVEDATSGHLGAMPETPIRRRGGRPKKVLAAVE